MMSSRRVVTITFPTILLSTSSKRIGPNNGFLSNGIKRKDWKASREFARSFSMCSFFIKLAMVAHKSVELSANCLGVTIPFQPSVSISECPESYSLFGALQTASASIFDLMNTFRLIRQKYFLSLESTPRMFLFQQI